MPTDRIPKALTDRPVRLLRCDACRRVVECSPEGLMGYTRQGWPRCCGEVMGLFVEATPPASDDTKLDRPQLPPA